MTTKKTETKFSDYITDIGFPATRALTGPIRSSLYYLAVHIPVIQELAKKRQPHTANFLHMPDIYQNRIEQIPLSDTPRILEEIDTKINNQSPPKSFIGKDLYLKFFHISKNIEHQINEKISKGSITEYVFFHPKNKKYLLFFITHDKKILPILIDENFAPETLEVLEQTGHIESSSSVELEIAINKIVSQIFSFNQELNLDAVKKINSVSNNFPLLRQVDFEHEGLIISTLRDNGIHTIGELQSVFRVLFTEGFRFSESDETITIDTELFKRAIAIVSLAFPDLQEKDIKNWIQEVIKERAYFTSVHAAITKNNSLVHSFMQSEAFQKHAQTFKEKHLASLGQSETAVASYMLAGYYLFVFESCKPSESRSQYYLANIPNYFEDIKKFLNTSQVTRQFQESRHYHITESNVLSSDKKDEVIQNFDAAIPKSRIQKRRHKTHQAFLGKVKAIGIPLVTDPRKGIFPTVIANLAIKKVRTHEGYQLLPTTWFPKTAGYLLRDADPLPDFNEQVSRANEASEINQNINVKVRNSIRYILNFGNNNDIVNSTTFEKFKEQEQRIISEAPTILEYLATSAEVPENIRNFIIQILSGEFAVRILERFGDISDQDPNIINRFFPEGLAVFNQTVLYRYAFDFIRGIETNVQINQGKKERIKAQFTGDWEPINIQGMSESNFERILHTVLHNAEHRLKWLNHETNTIKTLKDFQEKAEIIFGWDTEDMKFLRWTPFWDVWHTLGGAWDCVCFSRKTIFNSSSFKTA